MSGATASPQFYKPWPLEGTGRPFRPFTHPPGGLTAYKAAPSDGRPNDRNMMPCGSHPLMGSLVRVTGCRERAERAHFFALCRLQIRPQGSPTCCLKEGPRRPDFAACRPVLPNLLPDPAPCAEAEPFFEARSLMNPRSGEGSFPGTTAYKRRAEAVAVFYSPDKLSCQTDNNKRFL